MPRPKSQSGHLSALRSPAPDPLRGAESGGLDPASPRPLQTLAHPGYPERFGGVRRLAGSISAAPALAPRKSHPAPLLHSTPVPAPSKKHPLPHRPAARKGSGRRGTDKKPPSESQRELPRRPSPPPARPPERVHGMVISTTRRGDPTQPQGPGAPASLQAGQRFPEGRVGGGGSTTAAFFFFLLGSL